MRITSFCCAAALLLLAGCTPLRQYHTELAPCLATASTADNCDKSAVQEVRASAPYTLGVIEFDDQGHLFDRKQLKTVTDALYDLAQDQDLLMVAYVHGWKHTAEANDSDLQMFKGMLHQLAAADAATPRRPGRPPRRVAGIYLGWRGLSVDAVGLKELTFWDRKSTAHQVGEVGVAEVLMRLEDIKRTRSAVVASSVKSTKSTKAAKAGEAPANGATKLVIVGHSFGGAIVFSALAHTLEERFVATTCGPEARCNVAGFGDLVVLVNPAFEAMRFSTLSDMASERHWYSNEQLPLVAILTSEADQATKWWFPLGRRFSTFFDKERQYVQSGAGSRQIDEEDANITAVGHFAPFRTHTLSRPTDLPDQPQAMSPSDLLAAAAAMRQGFEKDDAAGKEATIPFADLTLTRLSGTPPHPPYLVAAVSRNLIADHNDLRNPRMLDFVQALIIQQTQKREVLQHYLSAK